MRHAGEKRWTERDVARLKEMARKVRVRDMTKILKRSHGAITAKAFGLRLSVDVKRKPDSK